MSDWRSGAYGKKGKLRRMDIKVGVHAGKALLLTPAISKSVTKSDKDVNSDAALLLHVVKS